MGVDTAAWRPGLRLSIRVVLAAMILLNAAVIIFTTYFSSRSALLGFSRDLIEQNAEMAELQLIGYIEAA